MDRRPVNPRAQVAATVSAAGLTRYRRPTGQHTTSVLQAHP
ncbi:hypothetical protein [Nocardia spumae]|nr:hypothetical protein [Nocardia spumae]